MSWLRHLPRTLLTLVVGLVATLVASATVILLSRVRPTSPLIEATARIWSRALLAAAGTKLQVHGVENVNPACSYVVVSNHQSNLDIMACFLALPIPIRFLAKKELFRVPIFASAMRAIGIVEVDRGGRAGIHDQINSQALSLIESGRSLIVYPEGTRSRQGELGPFKKGAFTMAVTTGLPVLPVSIVGSQEAWPPSSLVRGGEITVIIDPPVETVGLTHASTARLRDDIHAMIGRRLAVSSQS